MGGPDVLFTAWGSEHRSGEGCSGYEHYTALVKDMVGCGLSGCAQCFQSILVLVTAAAEVRHPL